MWYHGFESGRGQDTPLSFLFMEIQNQYKIINQNKSKTWALKMNPIMNTTQPLREPWSVLKQTKIAPQPHPHHLKTTVQYKVLLC